MTLLGKIDRTVLNRELEYWHIPGIAVGVTRRGFPDEVLCAGFRDKELGLSFNEDTIFGIASCSKSMNSALIAMLADEKKIDIDVPVKEYAPELRMFDPEADEKMTLRDMLCHRTGMGGYDILWPDPKGREDVAERIRYLKPNEKFREKAQYSNLFYALTGYVIEQATGRSWDSLMKDYIFEPLEMTRTHCLADDIISDSNHAQPYQMINDKVVKLPFWRMDMAGPAASVGSSIKDMLKWIRFHIDGGKNSSGSQLVSTENFNRMHQKHMYFDDSGRPDDDVSKCDGYGLGWQTGTYRGHPLQKHSGKINGYSSLQAYLPEDGIGIVLMHNLHAPADDIFYPLMYSILDHNLGFPEEDWFGRFQDKSVKPDSSKYNWCFVDMTSDKLDKETKGSPFEYNICDWLGSYADKGYGELALLNPSEDSYIVRYRDQSLKLHHWGENQFWLEGVKADTETRKVPVQLLNENDVPAISIWYEQMYEPVIFRKR